MKFTNQMYSYVIYGLISSVIVLIGMIIMKHEMPPRLVKIDLIAITNHYTQLMMGETTNSNSEAVKKISENIKINLEPIIGEYARNHNVVIIQAQALVDTHIPDITSQIIHQLDSKLK